MNRQGALLTLLVLVFSLLVVACGQTTPTPPVPSVAPVPSSSEAVTSTEENRLNALVVALRMDLAQSTALVERLTGDFEQSIARIAKLKAELAAATEELQKANERLTAKSETAIAEITRAYAAGEASLAQLKEKLEEANAHLMAKSEFALEQSALVARLAEELAAAKKQIANQGTTASPN